MEMRAPQLAPYMNPRVLFIITSDPRKSPRPAEAIRIAAGVGTSKKAGVSVYLRETAVLALGESVDDLADEDNFTRYLPLVAEAGGPIYVQCGAPWLAELGESPWRFQEITDAELADLAAKSNYVARF